MTAPEDLTTEPSAVVSSSTTGTKTLKAGAIGISGVLFMAVANAAPITAMTGNVPIAVGYGNGIYAPGGFLFATVVLTFFTIGYVAMAKHITTAGAFYGFVTHGLGQIWGMATGLLATMAYIVFEGSLIGIFAYFANDAMKSWWNVDVNWLLIGVVGIVIIAVLGYFDISIAAAILGFFLICEIVLLSALALSVLFKGGGPNGLMASAINPVKAFNGLKAGGGLGIKGGDGNAIAAGSAAIGIFFAFWSWVGYETTAVYGEESRNPKKIVPRATMIAVVGLGLFYTFVSWMVIAGNGTKNAIDLSVNNSIGSFTNLAAANLGGHWITVVYKFLIVSGSFACALAFHNAASRYIFAIGREVPALHRSLGATHRTHQSPHIASFVQSVITLVLTVGFYVLSVHGSDPLSGGYIYLYGLLALMGTMAILFVQTITSVAVIWYFNVKKVHKGNVFSTLISPIIGGLGMVYVIYLLFSNLSFAGGAGSVSPFYKAIPYIVGGTFVLGLALIMYLKARSPLVYASIGRTVMEETHERDISLV
ncbi:APC family permease [Acidothermaceae bacterium B102]|nr:APC family permease [Acidothermaceae bacterium B102]